MLAAIRQRLTSILACPRCGSHLRPGASPIQCGECQAEFRVDQGVPIFVDEEVEVVPEHTSNPIGPEFEQILRQGSDFVLNIGAGGTVERYPNCTSLSTRSVRRGRSPVTRLPSRSPATAGRRLVTSATLLNFSFCLFTFADAW